LAELEQDVNILGVFEKVLELDDVEVLNGSMDLDLAHKLLLGPTLGEGCFLNYLGCSHLLGVLLHELVTLGKASFSEEFPFDVLAGHHFTVVFDDFLLHNLREVLVGLVWVHL